MTYTSFVWGTLKIVMTHTDQHKCSTTDYTCSQRRLVMSLITLLIHAAFIMHGTGWDAPRFKIGYEDKPS